MVKRLEAEMEQASEVVRVEVQRMANAARERRATEVARAQELEGKAMERYDISLDRIITSKVEIDGRIFRFASTCHYHEFNDTRLTSMQ